MRTFSNRIKHLLRRFSAAFVLSPSKYVVLNRSGCSEGEIIAKLKHFFRYAHGAQFVVGNHIYHSPAFQTAEKMGVFRSLLSHLFFLLFGKILVVGDNQFWVNLQKILYLKVFVVDWTGNYRNSSWRFHCSSYDKPLINLNLVKTTALSQTSDSVVLLGTGPSAPLIFSEFFDTMPVITCNTAIKSKRLLERNILAHCFSDATFMLGSSAYSQAFLDALAQATKQKRFKVVYDFEANTFIRKHLPHVPDEDFAPVFLTPHIPIQYRFWEYRQQHALSNVLTSLMFPFGATYFKTIYCVGFDGKGTTQNYYWKHNDEFQFTNLLPAVKEADPAFFRDVDFDKYSAEHEMNLSKMLDLAQAAGTRIIMCHPSSIRPMKERFDADVFAKVQAGVKSDDFVVRQQ